MAIDCVHFLIPEDTPLIPFSGVQPSEVELPVAGIILKTQADSYRFRHSRAYRDGYFVFLVAREANNAVSLLITNRIPSDADALAGWIATHRSLRELYFQAYGHYPDVVAAGDGVLDMAGNIRASINRSETHMHGNDSPELMAKTLEFFGFHHVVPGFPRTFREGETRTGHVTGRVYGERERDLIAERPTFLRAMRNYSRRILSEFGSLEAFMQTPGYQRFVRLSHEAYLPPNTQEIYALVVDATEGLKDCSVYAVFYVHQRVKNMVSDPAIQRAQEARVVRYLYRVVIEARRSRAPVPIISEDPPADAADFE